VPDLGEDESSLPLGATHEGEAVTVLLEGQRVVAKAGFKPWISGMFSRFTPPEKSIKCQIHAFDRILQNLRVHIGRFWAHLFASRQFCRLQGVVEGFARYAVCIPALLQGGVIDFATQGKPLGERCLLPLRGIQAEQIGLGHMGTFLLRRAKPERAPPMPEKRHAPFFPLDASRGPSGVVFGQFVSVDVFCLSAFQSDPGYLLQACHQ
jgi:hypothetical protein